MNKKKLLAVVLSATMAMSGMPHTGFSFSTVANASEVKVNELSLVSRESADKLIKSEAEFFSFANAVSNGETYEGKTVKLTCDLDLSPYDAFYGVGIYKITQCFRGTFDGGGHTIYGAHVVSDGRAYSGIFNYVYEGTIKNLNVKNATIDGKQDTGTSVGGIVGFAEDTTISNCNFQGNVNSYSRGGGIVGYAGFNGTVEIINCGVTDSKISGNGSGCIGGIVGYTCSSTSVENSYFQGTLVSTRSDVGGLAGEASGKFVNCYAIPTFEVGSNTENIGLIGGKGSSYGSSVACYYLQNDTFSPIGYNATSSYNTTGYTSQQLKDAAFVKKLNNNKITYSKNTWTSWVADENGYPRLASINQVYFTNVSGVSLPNYSMYGEEGQVYSVTLKKGSNISKIIPTVYTIYGTKIESTYSDNTLSFIMPNSMVYMSFETVAATPTIEPTVTPTTEPTATPTIEPTATPTIEPTATPTIEPTATPTIEPTATPTTEPTATSTTEPTVTPTIEPIITSPTIPTVTSTAIPVVTPTAIATVTPSAIPSVTPTTIATQIPATIPTIVPNVTIEPTKTPIPTLVPTATPVSYPELTSKIKKITLYVGGNKGKTSKITAQFKNDENFDISFSSGNSKIAKVSSKGVITAKKAGTTAIYITLTNKTDSKKVYNFAVCTVSVKKAGITFKESVSSMKIKEKKTLTVNLKGLSGTVKWKTSNKKIATVSKNGVVKAKKAGKVTITATCGKFKKTCKIVIKK